METERADRAALIAFSSCERAWCRAPAVRRYVTAGLSHRQRWRRQHANSGLWGLSHSQAWQVPGTPPDGRPHPGEGASCARLGAIWESAINPSRGPSGAGQGTQSPDVSLMPWETEHTARWCEQRALKSRGRARSQAPTWLAVRLQQAPHALGGPAAASW